MYWKTPLMMAAWLPSPCLPTGVPNVRILTFFVPCQNSCFGCHSCFSFSFPKWFTLKLFKSRSNATLLQILRRWLFGLQLHCCYYHRQSHWIHEWLWIALLGNNLIMPNRFWVGRLLLWICLFQDNWDYSSITALLWVLTCPCLVGGIISPRVLQVWSRISPLSRKFQNFLLLLNCNSSVMNIIAAWYWTTVEDNNGLLSFVKTWT